MARERNVDKKEVLAFDKVMKIVRHINWASSFNHKRLCFLADVEATVRMIVPANSRKKFCVTYVWPMVEDEERGRFEALTVGDTGRILKARIGRLFIQRKIFPIEQYFKGIRREAFQGPAGATLAPQGFLDSTFLVGCGPFTHNPTASPPVTEVSEEYMEGCHMKHEHLDLINIRYEGTAPEPPLPGEVYFIQNVETKRIKIGFSGDSAARRDQLQTGNDCELRVIGRYFTKDMRGQESYLHLKFAKYLVRKEWYYPDQELLDYIAEKMAR